MSDQNLFDAMMQMSESWAKAMKIDPASLTPEGMETLWPTMPPEAMEAFFGKGVSPDGLDAKLRLMLTLAGLIMLGGQAEAQIRLTIRHLLAAGTSQREVTEAIAQMGLFAGPQPMGKAMELAQAIFEKEDQA